jgi:tRNA A-37 threonylcarbamoyl transferase component Bud32
LSVARPIIGANTLSTQPDRLSAPEKDHYVNLKLADGWTARVTVAEGRPEGRTHSNGQAFTPAQWKQWLKSPLQWVQQAQQQDIMKTSATTTVCRVRLPLADGRHVDAVCKRGRSRYLRKRLLNVFRTSRPMRTWRRAHTLLRCHIPTARPLAVVEKRRFGLLFDSLIITEYLRDTVDLESLLTVQMRGLNQRQAYRRKAQVSRALTSFLLRLQASGLYHRDLKALNVIVQPDRPSSDMPRICLVDLDGIQRVRFARTRAWMRMLMRLNVSVDGFRRVTLADRLRLLQAFLRGIDCREDWKTIWRKLAALSERKRRIRSKHQERSFRKYGRF